MTGAPLPLTAQQVAARAMPRSNLVECEARRKALRKANDEKYRQRLSEGWVPSETKTRAKSDYAKLWYLKNRAYLIALATTRNAVNRGTVKQADYEAKKLSNIKKAEAKKKIVVDFETVPPSKKRKVHFDSIVSLVEKPPNYFVSWN